ncbi:hypothetical protein BC343_15535 [Mucilaginibacter pedocola]|uniref:histidine kinase n=1 Tax=Mucilaginibacter pedocola TaxID=1792845 RepID=A0A1S9P7N0_9SPHI|nr:hypothetical protein BC343_15535 [Mucilaginibacter pedocola]
MNQQGEVINWNTGAARFFGFEPAEVLGMPADILFSQSQLAQALLSTHSRPFYQAEWQLARGGEMVLVKLQLITTNGEGDSYALLGQSLSGGYKPGNASDADSPFLYNESLFRQLIEHSHSGISLFDSRLNFIYRSPSAARITGFKDTQRAVLTVYETVHPEDLAHVKAVLNDLMLFPGQSRQCHFRCQHADGHFIHLDCIFTNWLDEPGIRAIVLNFHDVIETKLSETKLDGMMQELSAYQYALDEAAIVVVTDRFGSITHVNDYFCRISGYSREEVLGMDHQLLIYNHYPKAFLKNIRHNLAMGKIWRGDIRNRAKDKSFYWVTTTIVPFLNPDGKPYRHIAICYDITAGKQAEEELQRLFESVPDIVCTVGTNRRFRWVNPAVRNILGYTEDEFVQKTIDELIHPADREVSRHRMKRFIEAEIDTHSFENRYIKKDGSVINLAWSVRKSPEEGIHFCIARDITEKKQLEELLHKTNELAHIGSWALYPQTGNVFWSDITRELLEVAPDYDMQWHMADIFCGPESLNKINGSIDDVINGGDPFNIEIEVRTGGGKMIWVSILGEGKFDGGVCTQVYGTVQDIDIQKRAQLKLQEQAEELAASGQRYGELFHMNPLPMFVFDADTLAFMDINSAAIKQYGYSREEFLSMTLREIRPAGEVDRLNRAVEERRLHNHLFRPGVFTHLKKNGEAIQVEIVSSALQYHERPARLALVLDVTERNRQVAEIEAQNKKLREISWMQSHIVRAPLSRIMGLVNLLHDTNPNNKEIAEITGYIQLSAKELDQVIQNITDSAFSN